MKFADYIAVLDLKGLLRWASAAASFVIALADRRSASLGIAPVEAQATRSPSSEWEVVMGIARRGLAAADAASALHARAAERIDAAEYAFDRLLADCAPFIRLPVAPELPQARALDPAPALVVQQLAA